MLKTFVDEAAGGRPCAAHRIIKFCARKIAAVMTACDEHLAVGQQRRGVTIARAGEAASCCPCAGRRIVEFRTSETACGMLTPPATRTLPLGSNVAV